VDWDGLGTGRGAVGVGDACGAAANAVVVGEGFEGAGGRVALEADAACGLRIE
jgi:hypothetical protein